MTIAVLPESLRPLVEQRLPEWLEPRWWRDPEMLVELAPQAEIGWFDLHEKAAALRGVELARGLRWLNSSYAGVDWMPLADFARRGVAVTCGSGLTSGQVAEFAVMTMLAIAKDYRAVVQAQARHEWLAVPPAVRDLAGSRALILGHGAIGQAIGRALQGFGVEVVPVRSRAGEGALGPDDWRGALGSFDWIVLALPGTPGTRGTIGAAELAAMHPQAVLVNFARADVVDQPALVEALSTGRIHAAVLDLTDPEPLPADHPLWQLENAHITMHLSGIPTPASQARAAERFLRNCARFRAGELLEAQVELGRGY
ncbi:dehydrogenase [Altererythrobacter sp. B11]|uniref:D-2-hydroxyacid dehydrogenase n=1 Tax=Altererythrobacter sp. B11 TaxID=2060312 RepID=UPI000DC7327B|nr:D-2-hydroxyacid dehydrogenase [Altererythrobacter sp. B11]BBC73702.1 dehydrogenase [Altererythrobacter sp. B11]